MFFTPDQFEVYEPYLKQNADIYGTIEQAYEFGPFQLNMLQGNRVTKSEYVVYSIDAAFAMLGGYAALIWQIVSICLSWYQEFSYSN